MCMTIQKTNGSRPEKVSFGTREWVALTAALVSIIFSIGGAAIYIGGKLQVLDDHERRISRNEAWIDARRE